MSEQVFHGSESPQQVGRRLVTYAGHAGNVVRGIALETLVVGHLILPKPEALRHGVRPIHDGVRHAFYRGHDADVVVDELQRVQIAGDDDRVDVQRGPLLAKRAYDVVRLETGDLDHRDIERPHQLAGNGGLLDQRVRSRLAMGLILIVIYMPECRDGRIERRRYVVRALVEQSQEHGRQPIERVGRHARRSRKIPHREKRAV